MADTDKKIDTVIKKIEESYDLNINSIYSEYPRGCIPNKMKTPTGEKAKKAKFEAIDLEMYDDQANMVAFRVPVERMLLWIKALHTYYYDYLGNLTDYNIKWFDEPLDWVKSVEGKGNKAICIDVLKNSADLVNPLLYKITFFINTGVLQGQGNAKDNFAKHDFPILLALTDKIKQIENPQSVTGDVPDPVKVGHGYNNNNDPNLQDKNSEQTYEKQLSSDSNVDHVEDSVKGESTDNQVNDLSMTQCRPEKMLERMENCFLQALDNICTKQSELFTAKIKTIEDSYLRHMKENNEKLTLVLETVSKIQTEKSNNETCDQKLMNKINTVEHENSNLKMTIQEIKHTTEIDKLKLKSKLGEQTIQQDLQKQSHIKSIKQLETEIVSLGAKMSDKDHKLETLESACNTLKAKLEEKDGEIYSLKQHNCRSDDNSEFQEVSRRRHPVPNEKPHVILIGTSNIDRIDVSKLSSKFTVEKRVAYKFPDTEKSIRDIECVPEVIAFHSLTNELCENSAEFCVNKMKEMIAIASELFPSSKILLSAPTPRADSENLNARGQLISALLKQEYLESEKVYFCEHGNLANKGRAILRFISAEDKYHLSEQGANVFAANLRDTIDTALNLPKRQMYYDSDGQNNRGGYRGRGYHGFRGRGFRGQGYRGYQGRGRRYWRQ